MKKIFALLALASVFMGSFAQDVVPEEKYSIATNSFGSNWFVQAGLDWNAWYSAEERGHDLSKSPFKKFRSNPGISLAFGKWFTPGIGLRTKIQGFWGKKVDADWNEDTNEGNGNKYWVANEQVMFNLTNLFKGYKEERVWNMMAFAGAGVGRSMTHDNYAMNYSLGLHSAWKVAEKLGRLSKNHQIICITHLPQIASMEDVHFLIEKNVENGKTVSNISELNEEESVKELARMLGGVEITDTVVSNAREMKNLATSKK